MDEADALRKTCPVLYLATTFIASTGTVPEDGIAKLAATACCQGSACMWWRATGAREVYTGQEVMVRQPGGGAKIEREKIKVPQGHCGVPLQGTER